MFDALWQLIAAAGLGIMGLLGGKLWLSNRKREALQEREARRLEAERQHVADAKSRLEVVERNAANRAPIDPKKRDDFESGNGA